MNTEIHKGKPICSISWVQHRWAAVEAGQHTWALTAPLPYGKSLSDSQRFPAFRGFLMEGDSVIWIKVWGTQRNTKNLPEGSWLGTTKVQVGNGAEWARRKRKILGQSEGKHMVDALRIHSATGSVPMGKTGESIHFGKENWVREIPTPEMHLQRMSHSQPLLGCHTQSHGQKEVWHNFRSNQINCKNQISRTL